MGASKAWRMEALRAILEKRGADLLLLSHLPDIRWAVGFTGSHALLLVMPERALLLTDGRYTLQAREEVTEADVAITPGDLLDYLQEEKLLFGVHRALYQADALTCNRCRLLQERFPAVEWEGVESVTARLRAQKDDGELSRMRRAQAITDRVFEELLAWIRPGMTEKVVAAEIVYRHLRYGAERMAFDPIVAAGPRSALPHAQPSDRMLQEGEPLLLDFGCIYEGYASDMTRMVFLGHAPEDYRAHYRCVLEAQEVALSRIRAGVTVREVDRAARDVLAACDLEEHFTHSLGHGIGLEVHEWPRVSYRSEDRLLFRSVITVEPGIYLAGRYGIRIEDMVVVGEEGMENFTQSTKQLIEIH